MNNRHLDDPIPNVHVSKGVDRSELYGSAVGIGCPFLSLSPSLDPNGETM